MDDTVLNNAYLNLSKPGVIGLAESTSTNTCNNAEQDHLGICNFQVRRTFRFTRNA